MYHLNQNNHTDEPIFFQNRHHFLFQRILGIFGQTLWKLPGKTTFKK